MTIAERIEVRALPPRKESDLVLGDDFVAPDRVDGGELSARRAQRGWLSMHSSSMTRKIITFNLIALNVLVVGILYLSSSLDNLAQQRANALVAQATLIANAVEASLPAGAPVSLASGDGVTTGSLLERLSLETGTEVFLFDRNGLLVGQRSATCCPLSRPRILGRPP